MNPKAKIVHFTSVHQRDDVRILKKECRTLAGFYDVTLVVADGKGNENKDGVEIEDASLRPSNRFFRILFSSITMFLVARRLKPDVVHFHDPELMIFGILISVFTGSKVIYDVHEEYDKQIFTKPYLSGFSKKVISFLLRSFEIFASLFFSGFSCATETIAEKFKERKNVFVIRNYPVLEKLEAMNGENRNGKKVIYTGGLFPERGILEAVRAINRSKSGARLVICGKFSDPDFEKKVKSEPGFEKVDFKGWLNHDELLKVVDACDIGLVCLHPIPSYKEALPVKMFEYMQAGIPVIASDFPVWKEIITDVKCGVNVDPLNIEDIANTIDELLENADMRTMMGSNGRKAVLEKFNWQIESDRLIQLYNCLLS